MFTLQELIALKNIIIYSGIGTDDEPLINDIYHKIERKLSKRKPRKVSKIKQMVITMITHKPQMKYKEIAESVGCTVQYVSLVSKELGVSRYKK